MTARTPRSHRRMAGLVVALATALSLPGISHANHTTCTAQGSSDPNNQVPGACPEFSPGWSLDLRYPFRDTRADVNLEMSQADHESNALLWEWYLPAEWRFNTNLRPAGGAPASCNDLFNPNGSPKNAEIVSDGNSMIGRYTGTSRGTQFWGPTRRYFDPISGSETTRQHNSSLVYWRTAGSVTDLCLQMQNANPASSADQVILNLKLERGDFAAGGWKLTVPVQDIHGAAWATPARDLSITSLDIELGGLTGGNWNLENGIPTRTNFSRTPRTGLQATIATRAIACTNGADTLTACADANEFTFPTSGLQEFPVSIMQPPAYSPAPWAAITKAGDSTLPGAGTYYEHPVKGFGFSQDTTRLSVNWTALTPAALPSGVTAAGYVLAVHKVTRDIQPTTAAEIAAGRVVFARDFSNAANRAVSVDLRNMPANAIDIDQDGDIDTWNVDGKYNVSLVTIYNTPYGNGYRSDGLCDGASLVPAVADNGQGVLCPADRPIWMANGSARDDGTSLFQVLVRQDAWPRRYLYSAGGQPLGVLLLDIAAKRAEYTLWGATATVAAPNFPAPIGSPVNGGVFTIGQGIADQGPSTVYRATSDVMFEPTGPASGVVRFGNFDLESQGFTWNFAAEIQGALPAQVDGPVPDARGQFTLYNARGGDGDWLLHALGTLPDPLEDPASYPTDLVAHMQSNPPSGAPQAILGDFTGTAF